MTAETQEQTPARHQRTRTNPFGPLEFFKFGHFSGIVINIGTGDRGCSIKPALFQVIRTPRLPPTGPYPISSTAIPKVGMGS